MASESQRGGRKVQSSLTEQLHHSVLALESRPFTDPTPALSLEVGYLKIYSPGTLMSSSNPPNQYNTGVPVKWPPASLAFLRRRGTHRFLCVQLWLSCFLWRANLSSYNPLCLGSIFRGLWESKVFFFSTVAFGCLQTMVSSIFPSS